MIYFIHLKALRDDFILDIRSRQAAFYSTFFLAGYKKSTLKTLAMLDVEKICPDLIEALIEWIVQADHEVTQCIVELGIDRRRWKEIQGSGDYKNEKFVSFSVSKRRCYISVSARNAGNYLVI